MSKARRSTDKQPSEGAVKKTVSKKTAAKSAAKTTIAGKTQAKKAAAGATTARKTVAKAAGTKARATNRATTMSSDRRGSHSGRMLRESPARSALAPPPRTRARSRVADDDFSAGAVRPAAARRGRGQVEHAVNRYRDLLEQADNIERTLLMGAVDAGVSNIDDDNGNDLDENVFGPAPTRAETAAAELGQLALAFTRRREVTDASLTREAVADLLDVSGQTVLDWLNAGDLVGLRDGKRWMLPRWQFDADTERGFLPGIGAVAHAFAGGVVSLSRWMVTPSADLDARPPRQALAAGHTEQVTTVANALTAAGW